MITMFQSVLLLLIALTVIGPASSLKVDVEINNLSTPLTNLQFHDNKFYIGGQDNIYVLEKDLSLYQKADTCNNTKKSCNNVNSLLLVSDNSDGKYLITCGTGYTGICETRNLTEIQTVIIKKTDLVSLDIDRPVQGIVSDTDRKLMLAVTYGDGIKTSVTTNTYLAISKRDPNILKITGSAGDKPYVNVKINNGFVIYYKSSFQYGGFSFFTTIQKGSLKETSFSSKLVRLCQSDEKFASYVDLPINCKSEDTIYNILQTAVLAVTKSGNFFIGAFTRGNNPEIPESESVICIEELNVLDTKLNDSLKVFAISDLTQAEKDVRYLELFKSPVLAYDPDDFVCGKIDTKYAIGKDMYEMKYAYKFDKNNGYVSTLHATKLDGYDVVLAGTSKGHLYQFNLKDKSIQLFDKRIVDNGSEIKGIQEDGNTALYVMSTSKIIKYNNTDCSEFKTCQETMEKKNPHCGWCVYQNSSQTENLCPQDWIHSHEDCIELETDISGIAVGTTGKNVTVKAKHFVLRADKYMYKCRFSKGQTPLGNPMEITITDNTFICAIPEVKEHTEAKLELMFNDFVLASTPFLFYECQNFESCGKCVNTTNSNCTWDLENTKCITPRADDTNIVDKIEECPSLKDNRGKNYLANSEEIEIKLEATNIPVGIPGLKFWCCVQGGNCTLKTPDVDNSSYLKCSIRITLAASEGSDVPISVKYGKSNEFSSDFEDVYDNRVTVYSCEKLGKDCSYCKALKERYTCKWSSNECIFGSRNDETCPAPKITQIEPRDGTTAGGTKLTIRGSNLGINISEISISIADSKCIVVPEETPINESTKEYFGTRVPSSIVCKTGKSTKETIGIVTVTVNGQESKENVPFSYKTPALTGISPLSGPIDGGTILTLSGRNLGIGKRQIANITLGDGVKCLHIKVLPNVSINAFINKDFTIQCEISIIQNNSRSKLDRIFFKIDDGPVTLDILFKFLPNPSIEAFSPRKGTVSGGTGITITGKNLTNANVGRIETTYKGESKVEYCIISSPTEMLCKAPEAPKSLKSAITNMINSRRRKRSDCSACIKVQVKVYLDGYSEDFDITYYRDPSLYKFEDKNNVHLFDNDQQKLTIKGAYINLVAKESDVNITIGLESCSVFELRADSITCLAPKDQPASGRKNVPHPEVNVTIGNYFENVGYLEYVRETEMLFIILGAVVGGVFALAIIGIIVGCYKYRKVGKRARAIEKNLSDMEMEIKRVAREEFLDMHTTMSSVNKNLVEQGFPYHPYQQFACNVMFSVDYLWTEPVVSNGKMTDDERLKANRGMESLESLIYNKFFLVSVISTMENEKRFFIREKSNLAGNLCAVLMGRMDYLDEILKLLMNNLVQDSPARKHKALFRRCESITEKLLSNWLSLCLYPHVKSHSGSPLYLLYMATQKTMESGPIDAVTGDAKYTLSEEKLLKKWSSSMDEDNDQDLKFEAKTLTLNVVVDNGDEIFKCKVLDCDTISQVKNKCLNQIYVNFPASKLPVGANDLELEWHEGFGGTLKLRDEDNTSKREGKWVRFNTLAHYNVKDESNMALIDPHSADNNLEDYVNLANINMDGVCDGSIDSSQPLTLHDPENPHECEQWHLIKKEEESSKQGKGAITELYLNRLFTTKQSLMEYMRPLFDIILDHDKCPPPTKFLYDYLDELGEKYKVDVETVHAWKSHSYAIRVWASLMKMPNLLFDVSIPSFMDDNLEIISQVFIESFSLSTQKFTKDTPPQKLIFHHERNHYKDRVKEFYKNVKVDQQDAEGFRQYMADVNRLQQATEFNKVSALYRFYKQLKPYFEDIIDNLATSKEASNLQLDRKLEQVIAIMEEDD